jgi:hypothetical protein
MTETLINPPPPPTIEDPDLDIDIVDNAETATAFQNEILAVSPPDEEGNVTLTSNFSQKGDKMAWRDKKETRRLNRKIIITTEQGNDFYVYGDRIFDIKASTAQGRPVSVELGVEEPLPDLTIGEVWNLRGIHTTNIKQVSILDGKVAEALSNSDDSDQVKGTDKFADYDKWLKPYTVSGYTKNESDTLLKNTANRTKEFSKVGLEKALKVADKTGELALKTTIATGAAIKKGTLKSVEAGMAIDKLAFNASVASGAAIKTGTLASVEAGMALDRYAAFGVQKAYEHAKDRGINRVRNLGAFAATLESEMSKREEFLVTKDEELWNVDKETTSSVKKAFAHEMRMNPAASRALAKAVKNAWEKHKKEQNPASKK